MKQRRNLVILKGLNKVRKEGWNGMKLNISYIGNLNAHMFGIANKKITPNDANKLNYAPFKNERLNSINQIKFSKENFQELHLIDSIRSRNRISEFEEAMRKEIIPECFNSQLFNKKFAFISHKDLLRNENYKIQFNSFTGDYVNKSSIRPKAKQMHYKLDVHQTQRERNRHDRSVSTFIPSESSSNCNQSYKRIKRKKRIVFPFINLHQYKSEVDKYCNGTKETYTNNCNKSSK